MIILSIRTDKPEAEIGLFRDHEQLGYLKWQAHRELSSTVHIRIKEMLDQAGRKWQDIEGIVYFEGPGSFTGLRIGAAVANALAQANNIPLAKSGEKSWIEEGVTKLKKGKNTVAIPLYGSDPHITQPKK